MSKFSGQCTYTPLLLTFMLCTTAVDYKNMLIDSYFDMLF